MKKKKKTKKGNVINEICSIFFLRFRCCYVETQFDCLRSKSKPVGYMRLQIFSLKRSSEYYLSDHVIGEMGLYGMWLVAVFTLSTCSVTFSDRAYISGFREMTMTIHSS